MQQTVQVSRPVMFIDDTECCFLVVARAEFRHKMDKLKFNKNLLNFSESRTKASIHPILEMLGVEYKALSQVALSQIIPPDQLSQGSYERHICMTSTIDIMIVQGHQEEPLIALEYDGPHHEKESQQRKDRTKNELFRRAGLPLVRINYKEEAKITKQVKLSNFLTGDSTPATFLQYAIWFLSAHQSIERLIEKLCAGNLDIPCPNGSTTRSERLSQDALLRYQKYFERVRTFTLGYLGPTDNIVYAFGESLDHEKDAYWCQDIEIFTMRFNTAPTFRFCKVYDGIRAEARYGTGSFVTPAVQVVAFGFDQDACDNLALSFHTRCLLGRVGGILVEQELQEQRQRLSAMTETERRVYAEDRRARNDQLRERAEKRKIRREQSDAEYGPDELLLVSDDHLRRDLNKYKWNWETFMLRTRDTKAS